MQSTIKHPTPFTPPQSSKLSFAQLPLKSLSNSLSHNPIEINHEDELYDDVDQDMDEDDIYDDDNMDDDDSMDNDDNMDDDDNMEDDEEEDDLETDRELTASQYNRLASLREPSPNGILLFSADEPEHFDTLDLNQALQTEGALCGLAAPITSALSQYRTQFNQWELELNPPKSVIHASILIDQCLAKFVYALEPLKWILDDLHQFGSLLHQFKELLSHLHFNQQPSIETYTQLWNDLSRLSDNSNLIEVAFSDTSLAMNELCDWVDGLLTPALAQVKFPTSDNNSQISQILDVHSYLCESLVKSCTIFKIYLKCFKRISSSLEEFQSILSKNDHVEEVSNVQFPIKQTMTWASKWTMSLTPLIDSLTVYHAISSSIQDHTSDRFSSTSNKTIALDKPDNVALPPTPPTSSPNNNYLFPNHCVSYS